MTIRRLRSAWSALMDRQHRFPQGLIGRLVGERMRRQHKPETLWTLAQLDLRPDDRVLELGFGAGLALERLLPGLTGGLALGVDLSPTMIRSARRRLKGSPNAQKACLLCADILSLPLAAGSFDKIYSIHTFYFWRQSNAALEHLYRLLAPHGRLVLTVATAKKDARGQWVVWPLQAALEQETLPALRRIGFGEVVLVRGPDSRAYNNVALIAAR